MSQIPNPTDAVIAYADHADWAAAQAPPGPPASIGMPLSARVEARASETLDSESWRAQEEAWSGSADSRYRACVQRRRLGEKAAPIRVGVKDTVDVAGFPTRLGLRHHRHIPRGSTPAIAALPGVIAEVTAKVVTTELNIGVGSGCINPYAPIIDPAGSSTGAGVAVAAGICDLALGTDVLGSVRWPAGHCGTVGLRMTHDSSLLDGVFPLSPPMDALGWVARTANDLAYLWSLLGLDKLGRQSLPKIGASRIGVIGNIEGPEGICGPEMREALRRASAGLESGGHELTEIRLDELWNLRGPAWELCSRQAWDGYQVWRQWVTAELNETTYRALEVGSKVGDDRYRWILGKLEECRRTVESAFDTTGTDAWLLPLDSRAPPELTQLQGRKSTLPSRQDDDYDLRIGYTPVASFAGLPALTLPVARDERGAPLSVQLLGRPGGEQTLISLASQLAAEIGDLEFRPL